MMTSRNLRLLADTYERLAKIFSELETRAQACGNMPEAHRAADEFKRCTSASDDCERQAEWQEESERLDERMHGEEMIATNGPMG